MIFDIHEDDVYWCAADCGWVTGHSYIVYGPLANHTTGVLYEGAPGLARQGPLVVDHREVPRHDPLHGADRDPLVHALGDGAPRQARPVVAAAAGLGRRADQPRGVGLVLEGHRRRAVPGGRHVVADRDRRDHDHAAAGVDHAEAGLRDVPVPGIEADVVDERGGSVGLGAGGFLVLRHPWPAIARTIWGDPDRYVETYFSKYGPETYVAGDGARRDDEGYYWLLGRIDDVMNVAGHRLSTFEIESALVDDERVAEAAVVSKPHEIKGEGIVAFVTLKAGIEGDAAVLSSLRDHVSSVIGPIAKPDEIIFTPDLPKTRSGKIMRRLLRDVARGNNLGDVTTLANAEIVEQIRDQAASSGEE